jgi:hypothetical protein
MAHQAIISTISTCLPINPFLGLQHEILSDKLLEQDKLGQRALVERLSRFLRNPNTSPPLVISLQARWGIGKSSVMRMLESDLKENRAAVTVWFNAWHHQKEDQLLAYLLETIQREALPSWLSPVGLSFRFDLLRVRLFAGLDRLVLLLLAIAFLTLRFSRPDLFQTNGWEKWLLNAASAGAVLAVLQTIIAFKSNPEKLVDKAGGVLVNTLKELILLPSLVGKSDVRQEFASNLKDVVEALKPQRLVIFLDDLDRCKPEQVIQILEAINFLSSVASCVIIVGADYEKVETLVAMQFETIALREAENKGEVPSTTEVVHKRVAYARNYLKKIVNLRLNLHLPTATDYREMLKDGARERQTLGKPLLRAVAVAVLVLPILLTSGILHSIRPATPIPVPETPSVQEGTGGTAQTPLQNATPVPPASGLVNQQTGLPTDQTPAVPKSKTFDLPQALLAIGIPALVAFAFAIYWFSRPRRLQGARDAESFSEALEARSEEIFRRCESPREVRRFLNYSRLIATASEQKEERDVNSLRERYPESFDRHLVDLATMGCIPNAGLEGRDIEQYFKSQCTLFGLDPKTFQPAE